MRVAYLVSEYPAISHTFIRREVANLRARGVPVRTYSVRRAQRDSLPSVADQHEYDNTWAVLPRSALSVTTSLVAAFLYSPGRYVHTLYKAAQQRLSGPDNALWALFYFIEAIVLARELRRNQIQHLHCHFANAGSHVASLAATFAGIPWSLTLHGSACFNGPHTPLLGQKIADAEFVSCATYFGRSQAMLASDPEHWGKIIVVRCGVDLTKRPRGATRRTTRPPEQAGTSPLILSVGRLVRVKGHLLLLDALAQLHRRKVHARLRILGDGPMRSVLEKRARDLELAKWVELPGAASESEVMENLAEADVMAMSSFIEGLPVVLMEALSMNVAVVAPTVGGIPELVEDGVTGRLFAPGCVEQLAECLADLLGDAAKRHRTAEAGRIRVESEFSADRAVEPLYLLWADQTG